jgi:hypothetical protein
MLKFSELTLPQKNLIKEMRQGKVLKRNKESQKYILLDGQFVLSVGRDTAWSLWKRNYIYPCFEDAVSIQLCVNISIEYGKYLDEHNNLVGY